MLSKLYEIEYVQTPEEDKDIDVEGHHISEIQPEIFS
jgi:hypothetical protein